ncbi:alpha/beta fold hydrolase [Rhizobium leguminosarum bv. viciae 248]|uniref:alpha/beta hydrolase n=1 Tax=Rhizobium leguminosarum TaxID=384 RepID=UPI0013A6A434|nr:alpha/beta fold hydrolase [Rhizobium leguminosarum]QHW23265.2 alpha/beta fold hydrolase [Rhizobium leguminosarum bv. viciae 248]
MSTIRKWMRARVAAVIVALAFALVIARFLSHSPSEYYPLDEAATPIDRPAQWQACSWDERAHDTLAECAFISVPLDYRAPDGKRIRLLVKRRQATSSPRAQIWLVHGGPGASATAGMKDLAYGIADLRGDIAFYAVDHRGTGDSERLGCPVQEDENSPGGALVLDNEWDGCLAALRSAAGSMLPYMTTTAAAQDLALLIAQFRHPGVPVFVYGGSYGTYMVRRYLALASEPPDGVILEGVVAADGGMAGYDARLEEGATRLLDACDAADACSRHFKGQLRTETAMMLNELEDGHCRILNLKPTVAKQLLAAMTFYADTRVLIPPLVHRIRRCAWGDVWFVVRLVLKFTALTSSETYSPVLHFHVVLSEMYRPAQSARELQDQFNTAILSTGMELSYARLFRRWPRYEAPTAAARTAAVYAGPMLLLQGELDPASPLAQASRVARSFDRPAQHMVVFPHGAHGVVEATPTTHGTDCARQIYVAFISHPYAAPDTSCIADLAPLDWRTIPPGALAIAPTADLWGD